MAWILSSIQQIGKILLSRLEKGEIRDLMYQVLAREKLEPDTGLRRTIKYWRGLNSGLYRRVRGRNREIELDTIYTREQTIAGSGLGKYELAITTYTCTRTPLIRACRIDLSLSGQGWYTVHHRLIHNRSQTQQAATQITTADHGYTPLMQYYKSPITQFTDWYFLSCECTHTSCSTIYSKNK